MNTTVSILSNWYVPLQHEITYDYGLTKQTLSTNTGYYASYISLSYYLGFAISTFVFTKVSSNKGTIRTVLFMALGQGISFLLLRQCHNYTYFIICLFFTGFFGCQQFLIINTVTYWNPDEETVLKLRIWFVTFGNFFGLSAIYWSIQMFELSGKNLTNMSYMLSGINFTTFLFILVGHWDIIQNEAEGKYQIINQINQLSDAITPSLNDNQYQDEEKISLNQQVVPQEQQEIIEEIDEEIAEENQETLLGFMEILYSPRFTLIVLCYSLNWAGKTAHLKVSSEWIQLKRSQNGVDISLEQMSLVYLNAALISGFISYMIIMNDKLKSLGMSLKANYCLILFFCTYLFAQFFRQSYMAMIFILFKETLIYSAINIANGGYVLELFARSNSIEEGKYAFLTCTFVFQIFSAIDCFLGLNWFSFVTSTRIFQELFGPFKILISFGVVIMTYLVTIFILKILIRQQKSINQSK